MEKEIDINEVAISLEVDDEVIRKVRTGEINHIVMYIHDENYRQILENNDGNLVLVVDETPNTFHRCYLYNNGEFPYAIKSTLDFMMFNGKEDKCLARIIDIKTEPDIRFRFKGSGKSAVEDPNGDSCIWKVSFEVVPIMEKNNKYMLQWNPAISNFSEKDFEERLKNMVHGMFCLGWSIYEWQEARRGDLFYMLRTGDDKAGIAFSGLFTSNPYPGDDYTGSNKRRMYVNIVCMNPMEPGGKPSLTLEKLQAAIPSIDWSKVNSGTLLSEEIAAQIDELLDKERVILHYCIASDFNSSRPRCAQGIPYIQRVCQFFGTPSFRLAMRQIATRLRCLLK